MAKRVQKHSIKIVLKNVNQLLHLLLFFHIICSVCSELPNTINSEDQNEIENEIYEQHVAFEPLKKNSKLYLLKKLKEEFKSDKPVPEVAPEEVTEEEVGHNLDVEAISITKPMARLKSSDIIRQRLKGHRERLLAMQIKDKEVEEKIPPSKPTTMTLNVREVNLTKLQIAPSTTRQPPPLKLPSTTPKGSLWIEKPEGYIPFLLLGAIAFSFVFVTGIYAIVHRSTRPRRRRRRALAAAISY